MSTDREDSSQSEPHPENGTRPSEAEDGSKIRLVVRTLGQTLQREALRIAARRLPVFAWLGPFQSLLEQITSLPTPGSMRFRRVEAPFPAPARPTASLAETFPAAPTEAGRPLRPDVRMLLGDVVGPQAAALRVHEGPGADALARQHRADAVTVGRDVFFRTGRFQPQQPAGLALLAHEAVHVVKAMTPNADWRRATQAGVGEEEREAATVEQTALTISQQTAAAVNPPPLLSGRPGTFRASPQPVAAAAPPVSGPAGASPTLRPLAADADRTLLNAPAQPSANLETLREQLFRDLMARIKSDFERGA